MTLLLALLVAAAASAPAPLWSTRVPFEPGRSVHLDARAGLLLISDVDMADTGDAERAGVRLTIKAANVGEKDAEVVFTVSLLGADGSVLATEDDGVEIEEGDVKKLRFRLALPQGKSGPIATVQLSVVND
jgi:hypothetical protein